MLEKRGEELDLRHILIKPKFQPEDLEEAKNFLDSVKVIIETTDMTFEEAAREYSDDEATKFNGGILVDYNSGDTKWEINTIDRQLFTAISDLESGEISEPRFMRKQDQSEAFRLVMLRKKIDPHKANMKDDYEYVKNRALFDKQQKVMDEWVKKTINETYIMIVPDLFDCELKEMWENLKKKG